MSLSFPHGILSDESTTKLVAQLNDEDWQVKGRAARLLSQFGDERALPALLNALSSPELSTFVIEATGTLAGMEAVERLTGLLQHITHFWLRLEIAKTLTRLGQAEGVEELIHLLDQADWDVRKIIIHVLAKTTDLRAKETLIRLSQEDPDSRVQETALRELANFNQQPDLDALAEVMITGNIILRDEAALKLHQLGDPRAFNYLARQVERTGDPSAARLLGQLGDPRANELLLATLEFEDARLLKEASEVLGELGEQRAVELLLKLLTTPYYDEDDHEFDELIEEDENFELAEEIAARLAMARALLNLDPQRALPAIEQVMWKTNEPATLRGGLALLAYQQGNKEAAEIVQELLTHTYRRTTTTDQLVKIAGQFQDPAIFLEPLLESLKSEQVWQSDETLKALALLGDKRAIEPIKFWLSQLRPASYNYDFLVGSGKVTLIELGVETALADLKTLLTEVINWREKRRRFQGLDKITKRAVLVSAKIADRETILLLESLLLTELSTDGNPGIEVEDLLAHTLYQLKQRFKS